jgi:hypothetical protein
MDEDSGCSTFPQMPEEVQKSMLVAMMSYQQMLAAAATQAQTSTAGSASNSNSPPGSVTSASSPAPEQTAIPSPLLNFPEFYQKILQQQQQQQATPPQKSIEQPSFSALFGGSANGSTLTPEQVITKFFDKIDYEMQT